MAAAMDAGRLRSSSRCALVEDAANQVASSRMPEAARFLALPVRLHKESCVSFHSLAERSAGECLECGWERNARDLEAIAVINTMNVMLMVGLVVGPLKNSLKL